MDSSKYKQEVTVKNESSSSTPYSKVELPRKAAEQPPSTLIKKRERSSSPWECTDDDDDGKEDELPTAPAGTYEALQDDPTTAGKTRYIIKWAKKLIKRNEGLGFIEADKLSLTIKNHALENKARNKRRRDNRKVKAKTAAH